MYVLVIWESTEAAGSLCSHLGTHFVLNRVLSGEHAGELASSLAVAVVNRLAEDTRY